MKRLLLIISLIIYSYEIGAINPSRTYKANPNSFDLDYEEFLITTADGASINVWHLPSTGLNTPVIISESDAGNMGDWIYLGMYLQAYGLDVWMYDYRGFGASSEFEINHQYLYYTEFSNDLSAVVDYVEESTGKVPVLMGLSMGTIIIQEYLGRSKHPIKLVIYDGYVHNPSIWVNRLSHKGKKVLLPKGYEQWKDKKLLKALYIVANQDDYSFETDIPKWASKRNKIVVFESQHISSFFKYPKEYSEAVQLFVAEHER